MLVAALCLNFVGGDSTAYFLMFMLLLSILRSLAKGWPPWRFAVQPSQAMFAGAFLLVAVAFVASAREIGDLRYIGNFLMLLCFGCAASFLGRFARPANIAIVATLALLGSLLSLIVAFCQVYLLHHTRATGWGSDPIWSAQAALIVGFLAVTGCFADRAILAPRLFLAAPVFATITTWLTGSRGPMLAAPILLIVVLLMAGRRAMAVLFMAAIVGGLAILALQPPFTALHGRQASIITDFQTLLATGKVNDLSVLVRLTFWQLGAAAFQASPLFGYGWAHFLAAAYSHLPGHAAEAIAAVRNLKGNIHLHADILDMAAAAGVCGIGAYVLVLAAPIVDTMTSPRDSQFVARRLGAIILSVGYLTCGLSYLMFGYEFHTTLYVVLAALLTSFCRDRPPGAAAPAAPPTAEPDSSGLRSPMGVRSP
jgi:O-antigen ligase